MATIKPFKAIRPTTDKAAFVVSRSYQSYTRKELNAILDLNPFSFLQIINPGYKFTRRISGQERFELVHKRYLEFLTDNTFLKDATDSFYLYQVKSENIDCTGMFCSTSVADYRNNIIKKHEDTLHRREALFANYLQTVKFNAEPVLMTYKDNQEVASILKIEKENEPTYYFTTTDKVTHRLWVLSNKDTIQKLQVAFESISALYIADGHHRCASSNLLAEICEKNNPDHIGREPYNFFMSYLIPESEIRIFEFNRTVKDLNGHSKEAFLTKLEPIFIIKNMGQTLYKPTKKHEFSMYLEGDFYSLELKKKANQFTDALSRLDTQILYTTILAPLLGIFDLRKDQRIKYGFGKHNMLKMKEDIDKGKFKVGFGLVPLNIEEIKSIADAGLVMPPKSSYIEPKLRSGLAIYEL